MKTKLLIVAAAIVAAVSDLSPSQSQTDPESASKPWLGGSDSYLELLKGMGEQQLKEELPSIQRAAEEGDADAQLNLGTLYLQGRGVRAGLRFRATILSGCSWSRPPGPEAAGRG